MYSKIAKIKADKIIDHGDFFTSKSIKYSMLSKRIFDMKDIDGKALELIIYVNKNSLYLFM